MTERKTGEFETAIVRLEAIVAALEKGDVGLDESVKLYREGRDLAKRCDELLRAAERTIQGSHDGAPAAQPRGLDLGLDPREDEA